ncbi:peptide chain release factor N(5)-glutamine methyltransferase [Ancylobacter sp. Lp-2]|uniref:peptide chain release factor N(5)-glutamine methyltransferase n=1 Tax=Ancylobacter sp. Lp-2 TaxID=2881339 RepID=UPI001E369414|nr:peptide chain release factor N(5)-glutamine methyltransferase [Ancylobacter sp. Lp-2]MCB4770813.1 peptide chain release factor N(5)-glutamine methyltransferase [Ancylobacter sp. Lp-2]
MATTRVALFQEIAVLLATAGLESPAREARLLVRQTLGLGDVELIARGELVVEAGEADRLRDLARRRAAGEPLARLTGKREFWSLDFALAAETLVPRPDTETLVDAALAAFPDRLRPLRVLDLGTGSGAILAAILSERPNAFGIGIDRVEGAARQARANLAALGLGARAVVLVGDWGSALGGRFDLVVSNPPYIETAAIAGLEVDVRAHDPHMALDGGEDGLEAYRAIARQLPALLLPGGRAILELGAGQERAVARLVEEAGLGIDGPARADLSGMARALVTTPA